MKNKQLYLVVLIRFFLYVPFGCAIFRFFGILMLGVTMRIFVDGLFDLPVFGLVNGEL